MPNLQNIPIRTPEGDKLSEALRHKCDWSLLSADYSQVEIRCVEQAGLLPEGVYSPESGNDSPG